MLLSYAFVAVRSQRLLVAGWAVVLVVSGTAALAYSVSLSYSGNSFPERYARGVLAPSYRVAWGRARPGDAALVDPAVVASCVAMTEDIARTCPSPAGRLASWRPRRPSVCCV